MRTRETTSLQTNRAAEKSYWLVRDDAGPTIETDHAAILAGLQRELERISLIHDSSCIFVMSLDDDDSADAMDELCGRIAARLRSYDAVYRFANDKFLILLPHIGRKDAVSVIRRLRTRVMAAPFVTAMGEPRTMTASFGGTMLDSGAPLHEHMDRASMAHGWALKGNGDSICMWTQKH